MGGDNISKKNIEAADSIRFDTGTTLPVRVQRYIPALDQLLTAQLTEQVRPGVKVSRNAQGARKFKPGAFRLQ